jgi:hypothetical protein
MRYAIKYALAATFVASAAAAGHGHGHQHHHARQNGSPVEKREADAEGDVVIEYVAAATETVYKLGGEVVDAQKAAEGLDLGDYVVIGETKPTVKPPPPPPKPEPTTSSKANLGAQFIEKPEPTVKPKPAPKPKAKPEPVKPKEPKEPSNSGGLAGVDVPFPSGKVKCSEFPSKYGAVALDWLDVGGWSGLQKVPGFSASSLSISTIVDGIAGEVCTKGTMCSYACPPGYQKTQWPKAQGSTKQSVGGLYCNNEGYLELTRKEHKTLCEQGVGGVSIKNDLNEVVATCRTDYPGNEKMSIPATASAGESVALCNPDQENYYIWDNLPTSAQYYINPKGVSQEKGCDWSSADGPGIGNWAPMVAGVGKAADGITYLSIFQNRPTTEKKLDFNIEITGDVNSKCAYVNGKWTGGGDGCTTGLKPGGKAVFRYF